MSKYPLEVKVYKADFSRPNPTSQVEDHIVSGRYGKEDEEFEVYIIDPYNGNELGVYESLVEGNQLHDAPSFYYVGDILHNRDES